MAGQIFNSIRHAKKRDKHPCQLPVHLLERLLLMSTEEGEVVLDPFLGTGTTALAAKRLQRYFIGFEKDAQYCQIAAEKLKLENFVSKLGDSFVSFYLNEIVTLRDSDWNKLKTFFEIPEDIKEIDTQKIVKKQLLSLFV
ncbi:DNA-methyltransferase [Helicobacter felis]|uniref:DNA-methyltransferase n=1 Tax=Helicobacter felis TaxID=214 RepID=UPI0018F81104|nr:site-specific DNA-methyltransferase [Helicobacter felis]